MKQKHCIDSDEAGTDISLTQSTEVDAAHEPILLTKNAPGCHFKIPRILQKF